MATESSTPNTWYRGGVSALGEMLLDGVRKDEPNVSKRCANCWPCNNMILPLGFLSLRFKGLKEIIEAGRERCQVHYG